MKIRNIIIGVISIACLTSVAYASTIDTVRNYFLGGDYKACIAEAEKILAQAPAGKGLDELYYMLGLSYLKVGNYLRASDIFEIVLNEYKASAFTEEAALGLADSYFLKGDYLQARNRYLAVLTEYPKTHLRPGLYYRMAKLAERQCNTGLEKEYQDKLKQEFPKSPEALTTKDLFPMNAAKPSMVELEPATSNAVQYQEPKSCPRSFSVQVGAFSKTANADSLKIKLQSKGYTAFIAEGIADNKAIYKVRVGNFSSLTEAKQAEKKLRSSGYPTKIIP